MWHKNADYRFELRSALQITLLKEATPQQWIEAQHSASSRFAPTNGTRFKITRHSQRKQSVPG